MTIRKRGSAYELRTKDGSKSLGKYPSLKQAQNRERQVNYFKHKKG